MRLMTDRLFNLPLLKRYFSEPALREMEPIVTNIEVWAQGQINQERRRPATTALTVHSTPGTWEAFLQDFKLITVGLLVLTLIVAVRNGTCPSSDNDGNRT